MQIIYGTQLNNPSLTGSSLPGMMDYLKGAEQIQTTITNGVTAGHLAQVNRIFKDNYSDNVMVLCTKSAWDRLYMKYQKTITAGFATTLNITSADLGINTTAVKLATQICPMAFELNGVTYTHKMLPHDRTLYKINPLLEHKYIFMPAGEGCNGSEKPITVSRPVGEDGWNGLYREQFTFHGDVAMLPKLLRNNAGGVSDNKPIIISPGEDKFGNCNVLEFKQTEMIGTAPGCVEKAVVISAVKAC
jgi:hypothetical protein